MQALDGSNEVFVMICVAACCSAAHVFASTQQTYFPPLCSSALLRRTSHMSRAQTMLGVASVPSSSSHQPFEHWSHLFCLALASYIIILIIVDNFVYDLLVVRRRPGLRST